MVYLVPPQYFLIQLQLINHFFNSLTNERGVSDKKSVTMHSSITKFSRVSFTSKVCPFSP